MSVDDELTVRMAVDGLVTAILAAVRAELAAQVSAAAPARERLLTVGEAAATLGIGRSALYNELGSGRLKSLKVGRRRLIPSSTVAAYIEILARGGDRDPR